MVVACDLARNESGKVIIGPETKIACDRAVEIARKLPDYLVFLTAGCASEKWDEVWMADTMNEYIRTQGDIHCWIGKASSFNTDGEMRMLADMIIPSRYKSLLPVEEVILAVKWWHAPRSWLLCKYRLHKAGLKIPVSISSCPSNASWAMIAREIPAIFHNVWRILTKG